MSITFNQLNQNAQNIIEKIDIVLAEAARKGYDLGYRDGYDSRREEEMNEKN